MALIENLLNPINFMLFFWCWIIGSMILAIVTTNYSTKRRKKEESRLLSKQDGKCCRCKRDVFVDDNNMKYIDVAVDKLYCSDCYYELTGRLSDYE